MPRLTTKPTDHTLVVLKQIRDAVVQTNERLDLTRQELSQRIDETRQALSVRLDRVERRQTETEVRLATELTAVVGAVNLVRDAVLGDREPRRTVDDHEQRLTAIERRTG